MRTKPEIILNLINSGIITAEDAVMAQEPGSSMDRLIFTTACKNCGTESTHPLRWFIMRTDRCHCGGLFNMEPLRAGIVQTLTCEAISVKGLHLLPEIKHRGEN